ncbi:hypothetical protein [Radicibacter daui]|uniref:hypothetical protein n=1 Tax=Radicibacter daui TaxID=3064829 RepID=UPI004046E5E7
MSPLRSLWLLIMVGVVVTLIPWALTVASATLVAGKMVHETTATRLDIIGNSLSGDIGAYLDLGVPLDEAVGASDFLGADLAAYHYILSASLTSADGHELGSYKAPGSPAGAEFMAADMPTQSKSFPITSAGKVVGRLDLVYRQPTVSGELGQAGLSFLIALAISLVFGLQFILSSFRRSVLCPMQVADALEARMSQRRFDTRAPVDEPGPLSLVFEQINQLLVAVNERVATCRSYLWEVRDYSYNPAAAPAMERLEQRLGLIGRFAPDGMRELKLDHGDLLAGPAIFRLGALLALLATQAFATGFVTAPHLLLILLGSAAAACLIHELFGWLRLWIFAPLALAALIALPWLGEPPSVAVCLGVGTFAATACAQMLAARHVVARAGTAWHGLLGIFAGLGIAVLAQQLRFPALVWVAGIAVTGGLAALGLRNTRLPRVPAGETRSMTGKLLALIELLPALLFFGGLGVWLSQTGLRLAFSWSLEGSAGLLMAIWLAAGIASLTASIVLVLLRGALAAPVIWLALPLALFGLGGLFWFPIDPLGTVVGSAAIIGAGLPVAFGVIARARGGAFFPWATVCLAAGVLTTLDPPRQPVPVILFAGAAAAALFLLIGGLVVLLRERTLRRAS